MKHRPSMWTIPAIAAMVALGGCSNRSGDGEGFIESIMPPKPSDVARDAFNPYDPDQRRRSINLLSNAPWGGEAPYLRTYRIMIAPDTRDDDPTVRAAALRAIARHGGPEDVPHVALYLNPKEPDYVRVEAATALQRLHQGAAIEPLLVVLRDDEDASVRAIAANALGQYAEPQIFQALVGALNDEDYSVVSQSAESLQILTGKQFGDEGAAWLAWAENKEDLFEDQLIYYYPQFVKPQTTLDKIKFWQEQDQATPRQPAGLEGGSDGDPVSLNRVEPEELFQVLEDATGSTEPMFDETVVLREEPRQVEFPGGVKAAVNGQSEFGVHGPTAAYLRHGKMLASIPPDAAGFMIAGPGMTVIDRGGARFGLVVRGDGGIHLHVFSGRADLSVITPVTGILQMVPIDAGTAADVDASGQVLRTVADATRFAGLEPGPPGAGGDRPLGTPEALRRLAALQIRGSPPPTTPPPYVQPDPGAKTPHPLGATDAP